MKKLENKAEYLPLSELVKLENNPRTIKKADFEKLKESIKSNPDYFEARPIICSAIGLAAQMLILEQRIESSVQIWAERSQVAAYMAKIYLRLM